MLGIEEAVSASQPPYIGALKGGEAISRIDDPGPEELSKLIRQQEPFVVRGLFRDQPIAELATLARFSERFGDLRLSFMQEYAYEQYQSVRHDMEPVIMSVSEYLQFASDNPQTPLICVEDQVPDELRPLFNEPSVVDRIGEPDDESRTRFFLGNPGNRSSFHFDADMRAGLLHQIFGYKTAVLVAPAQSDKMLPVMNFSGWTLQHMDEEECAGFAAFVGARVCRLAPGETLFIPTAGWHHVGYDTFSCSISIGLRRESLPRLLGSRQFHWSYRSGAMCARVAAGVPAPPGLVARLRELLASGREPEEVFDAVEALYATTYGVLCGAYPRARTATPVPIPERIYWAERLASGRLYASKAALVDAR